MHYLGPEVEGGLGGGSWPRSSQNERWYTTIGLVVFSTHVAHYLDTKTFELSAKRVGQGKWRFIQVNNNTF